MGLNAFLGVTQITDPLTIGQQAAEPAGKHGDLSGRYTSFTSQAQPTPVYGADSYLLASKCIAQRKKDNNLPCL